MPEDIDINLRVDAREVDGLTKRFQRAEKDVRKNFEGIRRTSNRELETIARKGVSVAQRFSRAFPGAEIAERAKRAFSQPVKDLSEFQSALTRVNKASEVFQSQQTRLANRAKLVDTALARNVRSLNAFQSAVARRPVTRTRFLDANRIHANIRRLEARATGSFAKIEQRSERLGDKIPLELQEVEKEGSQSVETLRRKAERELERIARKAESVAGRYARAFQGAGFRSARALASNTALGAFQSVGGTSGLRLTRQGFLNQIGARIAREREQFGTVGPGGSFFGDRGITGAGPTRPEGLAGGEFDFFRREAKRAFEDAEKEAAESAQNTRRSWARNLERIEIRLRGFASRLRLQRRGQAGFASPLQAGPEATTTNRVTEATNRILERTGKLLETIQARSRRARSSITSLASAGGRGIRRFNQTLGGMSRRLGRVFSILGRIRTRIAVLASGVVFGTATGLFRRFLSAIVNFGKRAEISIVQLGTLFRTSRKDATDFFQAIRAFARPLPATTESVVNAFIRLKSVGVDPTAESIQALINASIALGRPLENIVLGVQSLETESLRKLGINLNRRGDRAILSFGAERIEIEKDDTKIREALLDLFNRAFAGALEGSLQNFQVALDVFRSILGDFFVPAGLNLLEKSLSNIVNLTSAWLSENRKIVESRILLFVERLGTTLNEFATPERIDRFLDSLTQFIATDLPRFISKVGDLFEYVFDNIGRLTDETARFAKIALPLITAITGAIAGSAFGPIGTIVGGVGGGVAGGLAVGKISEEIEKLREALATENERRLAELRRRRDEVASGAGGDPFSRRSVRTRAELEQLDEQIKAVEDRIEAEERLAGKAGETTTIVRTTADGVEGLNLVMKELDRNSTNIAPVFDDIIKSLSRFNKGSVNFIGRAEISSAESERIRELLGSAGALLSTDVSSLARLKPQQLNQAITTLTEGLTAIDAVGDVRADFLSSLVTSRDRFRDAITDTLALGELEDISETSAQNLFVTETLVRLMKSIEGQGLSPQQVQREIVKVAEQVLSGFDEGVAARGGLNDPLVVKNLVENLSSLANAEALALVSGGTEAVRDVVRDKLTELNLGLLAQNVEQAFITGIDRGVQGLLRRGFSPTQGFFRFADTAFNQVAQSTEQFIARQLGTESLIRRNFLNLLENAGDQLKGFGGLLSGLRVGLPNLGRFGQFLGQTGGQLFAGGANLLGAVRQGNILSAGLSGGLLTTGAFAGLTQAGILTGAAGGPIGLAVAAGIGIIGGIIGSIFGRKKSRISVVFEEALGIDEINRLARGGELTKRLEESISINTKRTGITDAEKSAIKLQIAKLIDAQVDSITEIFRTLPSDVFVAFDEAIAGATLREGQLFYRRTSKTDSLKKSFEDFVQGIGSEAVVALESGFAAVFQRLGIEGAAGFVRERIEAIDSLTGEARATAGEEFIKQARAFTEAFNILSGNLGIRGSIERARNLAREFLPTQTRLPTFQELNTELSELLRTAELDTEVLARWKELRGIIIQLPQQVVSGISQSVTQISAFSEFATGGTPSQARDALVESLRALTDFRSQEGLVLEERLAFLNQEHNLLNQIIALERDKFQTEIEASERVKSTYESVLSLSKSIDDAILGLRTGADSPLSPAQQVATLLRAEQELQARLPGASDTERIGLLGELRDLFPQFATLGGQFGPGSAAQRALFRFSERGLLGVRDEASLLLPTEAALAKANQTLESDFQVSQETRDLIDMHMQSQLSELEEQTLLLRDIRDAIVRDPTSADSQILSRNPRLRRSGARRPVAA